MVESGIQYLYPALGLQSSAFQVFNSFITGTGNIYPSISPASSVTSGSGYNILPGPSGLLFTGVSGSYYQILNPTGLNSSTLTLLFSQQSQLSNAASNRVGGCILDCLSTYNNCHSGFNIFLTNSNQLGFFSFDKYENPYCAVAYNQTLGEKNILVVSIRNGALQLGSFDPNYGVLNSQSFPLAFPILFNQNWFLGKNPASIINQISPYNGFIDGFLGLSVNLDPASLLSICSGFYSYPSTTPLVSFSGATGLVTGYNTIYTIETGFTGISQNVLSGIWAGSIYEPTFLIQTITGTYFTGGISPNSNDISSSGNALSGIVFYNSGLQQCRGNQYNITGNVGLSGVTGFLSGIIGPSGLYGTYSINVYTTKNETGVIGSGASIQFISFSGQNITGYSSGLYTDPNIIKSYGLDSLSFISSLRDNSNQDIIEYNFYETGQGNVNNNYYADFDNAAALFQLNGIYNATGINMYLNGQFVWGSGAYLLTGNRVFDYVLSGQYIITGYLVEDNNYATNQDEEIYDIFLSGVKGIYTVTGSGGFNTTYSFPVQDSNQIWFLNGQKLYSGVHYYYLGGQFYPNTIIQGFSGSFLEFISNYSGITTYTGLGYDVYNTGKFSRGASMSWLNGLRQDWGDYKEHSYLDLLTGTIVYITGLPVVNSTINNIFIETK